jgi:hypothetical protein
MSWAALLGGAAIIAGIALACPTYVACVRCGERVTPNEHRSNPWCEQCAREVRRRMGPIRIRGKQPAEGSEVQPTGGVIPR